MGLPSPDCTSLARPLPWASSRSGRRLRALSSAPGSAGGGSRPGRHRNHTTGVGPVTAQEAAHVKRTFQPNSRRRAKRHGFRHRMSTRAGRAVIRSRRLKGRARLSA